MRESIVLTLLAIGAAFMLLAALGLVRLPDVYMRMQATTKAATLGLGGILLAVAVHFEAVDVSARAILGIAFILITAPISAHMIARATYFGGVPLWEGTVVDELSGAERRREPPRQGETPEEEPGA